MEQLCSLHDLILIKKIHGIEIHVTLQNWKKHLKEDWNAENTYKRVHMANVASFKWGKHFF